MTDVCALPQHPFRLRSLRPLIYRSPISQPVITSFGRMDYRPMLLVRAEDVDGWVGWGEVWCNFPDIAAEHRARLISRVLAPLVENRPFSSPLEAFGWLSDQTATLSIQAGEPGPFAQAIAGIDIAVWDLLGRRASKPLWKLLGGASPVVGVYASGLNPDSEELALRKREEGYTAFKVKLGFGRERDLATVSRLRRALDSTAVLMADVNQGWTLEQAIDVAPQLESCHLSWLEEPLRADRPWSEWSVLRRRTAIPLAAGENLAGQAAFESAIASGVLDVIQPDIAKWGGFSGCLNVARRIVSAGLRYCPHYLGGGIGLLASAHLLAAVGGNGLLEVDANPNPLRERVCGPILHVRTGQISLPTSPGLGVEPDLKAIARYAI